MKKFVSFFIYKTNTTFNINKIQKFFLIFVRILNTKKTFFFNLYFIILETIALFEFIKWQLDNLFFYNCPYLKIIYGKFIKA